MGDLRLSPRLNSAEWDRSLTVVKDLKDLPKSADEIRGIYGQDVLDELSDPARRDVILLFEVVRDIRGPWTFIDRRTLELADLVPDFADAVKAWADSVVEVVKGLKSTEGYRRVEDLTEEQIQKFDAGILSDNDRGRFVTVAGTIEHLKKSIGDANSLTLQIQQLSGGVRENIDEVIKPLFQRVLGDFGDSAINSFKQVEVVAERRFYKVIGLVSFVEKMRGRINDADFKIHQEEVDREIKKSSMLLAGELETKQMVSGCSVRLIVKSYPLYCRLNEMNKFVAGFGDALRKMQMLWVDAKVFIESSENKISSINDKRSLRLFVADITGVANDWQVIKADVQSVVSKHKEL